MNDKRNISLTNISAPFQPPPPWLYHLPDNQRTSFTLCYSFLLGLSILCNVYIIAIVFRNRQMRSTMNYLIVNMACSDLAGSIACISTTLAFLHNKSFQWLAEGAFGNVLCKVTPFIRDVSITVSIVSMIVIGFDRFFAVVFPMSPTPRLLDIRFAIPMTWLIAIASFCVHLVTYKLVPEMPHVYVCVMIWPKNFDQIKSNTILYLFVLIPYFVLPFVIITVLYSAIACKIKKQILPGQQSEEMERMRRIRNLKIIKMALTIVMCFFACWFPYHIVTILIMFVWKGTLPPILVPYFTIIDEGTLMLSYVSFFINPLICLIFSSNFRRCLKSLFPFNLCGMNQVGIMDSSSRRNASFQPSRGTMGTSIAMNAIHPQQLENHTTRENTRKASLKT